jgi:very-short-patch-repair endonuclease
MTSEKHLRIRPEIRQRSRELRHPLTPAEASLWSVLRSRDLGAYKFRRQHPIGHFIVDFYCAEAKLVIEVDGDIHASQEAYDAARSEWLQTQGYTVIRFKNREVWERLDDVIGEIVKICYQRAGKDEVNP